MTRVTWEEWEQTFFHPLHPMGMFRERSRDFKSEQRAHGFADGLKTSPLMRNIRIDGHKV